MDEKSRRIPVPISSTADIAITANHVEQAAIVPAMEQPAIVPAMEQYIQSIPVTASIATSIATTTTWQSDENSANAADAV